MRIPKNGPYYVVTFDKRTCNSHHRYVDRLIFSPEQNGYKIEGKNAELLLCKLLALQNSDCMVNNPSLMHTYEGYNTTLIDRRENAYSKERVWTSNTTLYPDKEPQSADTTFPFYKATTMMQHRPSSTQDWINVFVISDIIPEGFNKPVFSIQIPEPEKMFKYLESDLEQDKHTAATLGFEIVLNQDISLFPDQENISYTGLEMLYSEAFSEKEIRSWMEEFAKPLYEIYLDLYKNAKEEEVEEEEEPAVD